jgi:hypothetical protein
MLVLSVKGTAEHALGQLEKARRDFAKAVEIQVGLGRMVVSETELPNMLANLV